MFYAVDRGTTPISVNRAPLPPSKAMVTATLIDRYVGWRKDGGGGRAAGGRLLLGAFDRRGFGIAPSAVSLSVVERTSTPPPLLDDI